jgi:hypothetical protein
MTALIDAEKKGELDSDTRSASLERMKALPAAHAAAPAIPLQQIPPLPVKKSAAKP